MKTLVPTIAAGFLLLFVLTTFVPYPEARLSAREAGFSAAQIDTGLQYSFERRLFFWGWTALDLTLLYCLAMTGLARRLADRLLLWTGGRRILAALGVGLIYLTVREVLYLPVGIGRHYHSLAWGMTNLDLAGWFLEQAKAFAVDLLWQPIVVAGFYTLLIGFPRTWWLLATLGGGLLGMAFAFLAPIVINPLFNDFTPLSQTKWKDLQPRLQYLIDKAGVPVQDILVMDASRQSNHSNAYFTGFGSTRRIVLYDNLLKSHSPEQIESILGHELGHWRNHHIIKGILLAMLAALVGFFLLDRLLRAAAGRAPWHLQSIADPAGLPLILLLVYLGSWIALPAENVVSRYFETQADESALELADQPKAFEEGERKLCDDNKLNVAPTPWNAWLFNTHPTAVDRIRMAKDWKDSKK